MARSRIVIVEGKTYLVPRKKYKVARRNFANPEDAWAYIMENIVDFGQPLEEETEEEEAVEEEKPKKRRSRKKEAASE